MVFPENLSLEQVRASYQNLNKCSVSIVFLYFLYILATPYQNNIRNNISILRHCSE